MISLLVNNPDRDDLLNETSFGGLPVRSIDENFEYPKCKTCKSDMQYQGKVKTDIGLELIFICQHTPGLCDEWEPDGGGNRVVVLEGENLESFTHDSHKTVIRETNYACKIIEVKANDYEDAIEKSGVEPRDVLGKLFGEAEWLQGDETPNCNCCNKKMRFVSLLEEGPNFDTAMNFGGGIGYLFDCEK